MQESQDASSTFVWVQPNWQEEAFGRFKWSENIWACCKALRICFITETRDKRRKTWWGFLMSSITGWVEHQQTYSLHLLSARLQITSVQLMHLGQICTRFPAAKFAQMTQGESRPVVFSLSTPLYSHNNLFPAVWFTEMFISVFNFS